MLYACHPAATVDTRARRAASRPSPRKVAGPIVDIHCHIISPAAADLVQSSGPVPNEAMSQFSNEAARLLKLGRKKTRR